MKFLTDPLSLPWSEATPFWQRVLLFLKISPVTTLIIYCVLSVKIQENFPFSNFPMYSNPSAERMYYTISTGDGKGLPVATLTGITSPKIGKIYRKKADELSQKNKTRVTDITPEQVNDIGREIIAFLRGEAAIKHKELPPKLQINRITINYQDGKIIETPTVISKE